VRGVHPEERELLEKAQLICPGVPYTANTNYGSGESQILLSLIAQRRMYVVQCGCGRRHPYTSAEGKQALLLDTLAKSTHSI
jgi:hypothetical protein